MKCSWPTPCSNVIVEIWHPREDSGVEETKAFCKNHSLEGEERKASSERVGYDLVLHQATVRAYWIVDSVPARAS